MTARPIVSVANRLPVHRTERLYAYYVWSGCSDLRHGRVRGRSRHRRRRPSRRRDRPHQCRRSAPRRHVVCRPTRRVPRHAKVRPRGVRVGRPLDTGRTKQYRRGLAQLDEEGVVQVLRDPDGGDTGAVLAAVGQLQFEVFTHRLATEFGAPAELLASPYEAIRSTDPPTAQRLRGIDGVRILRRDTGELVALFENRYRLQRLENDDPELVLRPLLTTTS